MITALLAWTPFLQPAPGVHRWWWLLVVPMALGAGSQLAGTIASDIWMWVGALAGGTVFCGVVGFFIGRQLE